MISSTSLFSHNKQPVVASLAYNPFQLACPIKTFCPKESVATHPSPLVQASFFQSCLPVGAWNAYNDFPVPAYNTLPTAANPSSKGGSIPVLKFFPQTNVPFSASIAYKFPYTSWAKTNPSEAAILLRTEPRTEYRQRMVPL